MITDFKLHPKDRDLINKIVKRVVDDLGLSPSEAQSARMDLTAVHKYDVRLDLTAMLAAPAADLGHDVFGISKYIDRETGKLDGFVPRLHVRERDRVWEACVRLAASHYLADWPTSWSGARLWAALQVDSESEDDNDAQAVEDSDSIVVWGALVADADDSNTQRAKAVEKIEDLMRDFNAFRDID